MFHEPLFLNNDSEIEGEDELLSDFEDITQSFIVDPFVNEVEDFSGNMSHLTLFF